MSAKMTETLEKHVPIAQKFHKSKPVAEEDLIAPKKVLLPFNTFLLCSQWLVFIIMLVYRYIQDLLRHDCTPSMDDAAAQTHLQACRFGKKIEKWCPTWYYKPCAYEPTRTCSANIPFSCERAIRKPAMEIISKTGIPHGSVTNRQAGCSITHQAAIDTLSSFTRLGTDRHGVRLCQFSSANLLLVGQLSFLHLLGVQRVSSQIFTKKEDANKESAPASGKNTV